MVTVALTKPERRKAADLIQRLLHLVGATATCLLTDQQTAPRVEDLSETRQWLSRRSH